METVTSFAFGARTRNVTRRSAWTSGETRVSACGHASVEKNMVRNKVLGLIVESPCLSNDPHYYTRCGAAGYTPFHDSSPQLSRLAGRAPSAPRAEPGHRPGRPARPGRPRLLGQSPRPVSAGARQSALQPRHHPRPAPGGARSHGG